MSFPLVSDAQARLKVLTPEYDNWDSTKFDNACIAAAKLAIQQMQANYIDAADIFARGSTLSTTAPSSGAAVADTTAEDMYYVALITGAVSVAGDTIILYNPTTADYKSCPRITLDELVVGTTVVGFYETNGNIVILFKDSTFTTTPFKVQYDYWRVFTVPAATSDALDIKPTDFDTFVDAMQTYMPATA